jgi:pimeloyl-ACP methyl ester carboxylesterase
MKPLSSGYADVNGIKLYHEIYGRGEPVVPIHGGLRTIGEMQRWVQPLANTWQVIAVEMQGHGRTADTDQPMSFTTMGDDIAAPLYHLKIPKADLLGHSFGGASAIRAAIGRGSSSLAGRADAWLGETRRPCVKSLTSTFGGRRWRVFPTAAGNSGSFRGS